MSRTAPTDHGRESWRVLALWAAAVFVLATVAVTFVLWGTQGPAYLIDLIASYCF